jgi:hypothetical protein
LKRYDAASRLPASIQLDPNVVSPHNKYLGSLYRELKRYDEASRPTAVFTRSRTLLSPLGLGNLYHELTRYDDVQSRLRPAAISSTLTLRAHNSLRQSVP